MSKILSFIIPAYNAENYIGKCVDSLLGQKCFEDIEILVVNDGSTDNTEKIINSYVEKYGTNIRILNKKNGGHGSAINLGVQNIVGKYFRVIDADDWIISENLPGILEILKNSNVNVIINDFHTYNIRNGVYQLYSVKSENDLKEINLAKLMSIYKNVARNCSFHGICFSTDFYLSTKLTLTEKVFYDDNEFAIIPMLTAKSIKLLPISFYQYRIGDSNQSVAFHNQIERINDLEIVTKRIICYVKENNSINKNN